MYYSSHIRSAYPALEKGAAVYGLASAPIHGAPAYQQQFALEAHDAGSLQLKQQCLVQAHVPRDSMHTACYKVG